MHSLLFFCRPFSQHRPLPSSKLHSFFPAAPQGQNIQLFSFFRAEVRSPPPLFSSTSVGINEAPGPNFSCFLSCSHPCNNGFVIMDAFRWQRYGHSLIIRTSTVHPFLVDIPPATSMNMSCLSIVSFNTDELIEYLLPSYCWVLYWLM